MLGLISVGLAALSSGAMFWFAKHEDPAAVAAIPVSALPARAVLNLAAFGAALLIVGSTSFLRGLSEGGIGLLGLVLGPVAFLGGVILLAGSYITGKACLKDRRSGGGFTSS